MNTQSNTMSLCKQWKSDAGYTITLTCNCRRSRVDVRDGAGQALLHHEFEYWQQGRAEQEAEALAQLAHAVSVPAIPHRAA